MARDLKVFGMVIAAYRDDGIEGSQASAIVAAKTKVEAARLLGVSIGDFYQYASETGNAEAIELAMSKPGQVFGRSANRYIGKYVEITRQPRVSIPRRPRKPYVAPKTPVSFTVEELEMIAGYFSDGNSPLAQSICDKARSLMETNNA